MSAHSQGTRWRRKISENFYRLSRVHERYRQTDDRRTDGRQHISNVNVRMADTRWALFLSSPMWGHSQPPALEPKIWRRSV